MPPMKTQKKNVEASAYKELLAGVPEALEEALIWGNDWKQAFEWLRHGTNDIPNRVNNLYHVDRAGTNRKGRWVTLYTDRYEESDAQDLQRVAMMGMQGRVEECQAMGCVAGQTYDILVYRWLEHPQAETTKCYTLIHELREHDFYIGETAITPSPVPNEPGPETFIEQPRGQVVNLNALARSTLAWMTRSQVPGPEQVLDHSAASHESERNDRARSTRKLRHQIWLHPSVSDDLRERPALYRRLGLILEQLAATGRTSITKHCRAPNEGWYRSPLGSDNDHIFHLWWTRQGTAATEGMQLPTDAVVVHAVREQGDNHRLEARQPDEYLELATGADIDIDIAGEPWTAGQSGTRKSTARVMLISGPPGAGKTTALWHAVDAGNAGKVLYVTWSAALATDAKAHFESFAPAECEVDCTDFASLLGRINGGYIQPQALSKSQELFEEALQRSGYAANDEWHRYPGSLYAEVRGTIIGGAQPGSPNTLTEHGIARLTDEAYQRRRCGNGGIGSRAARNALKAVHGIGWEKLSRIFPELAAATAAHQRLKENLTSTTFNDVDEVIVDETQDLTLLETSVIIELCRQIEHNTKKRPRVLIAGDSGQRVRPTGFEWSRIGSLLTNRLERPTRTRLNEHVRCPVKIADVTDRAGDFYTFISKRLRPTRQSSTVEGDHIDGRLLHLVARNTSEAAALVRKLADADGLAIVTAETKPPDWVPAEARRAVLNAAEIKGLEYQTVCITDAGISLLKLATGAAGKEGNPLHEEEQRTAIDRLRVCVSRATETLVLMDIAGSEKHDRQGSEGTASLLANEAGPWTPADFLEYLAEQKTDPEEQVERLLQEAESLHATAPERAWERACQALTIAGDRTLPNAVADTRLRRRIRRTVLELASIQISNSDTWPLPDHNASQLLMTALRRVANIRVPIVAGTDGSSLSEQTLAKLRRVESEILMRLPETLLGKGAIDGVVEGLNGLKRWLRPEDYWPETVVRQHAETLITQVHAGAKRVDVAQTYLTPIVKEWLQLLGQDKRVDETTQEICREAARTLLDAMDEATKGTERDELLEKARRITGTLRDTSYEQGRLAEAEGDIGKAIELYERVGATNEALRALRKNGDWRQASEKATGTAKTDLEWLQRLEALCKEKPEGLNKRLYPAEIQQLNKLVENVGDRQHKRHRS